MTSITPDMFASMVESFLDDLDRCRVEFDWTMADVQREVQAWLSAAGQVPPLDWNDLNTKVTRDAMNARYDAFAFKGGRWYRFY